MFRRVALALAWLLAAFHGWLLAVQVLNGEIAEPWLALRWAGAIFIAAGFAHLRRSGRSVLRGRRAVALWLMVALLHAPAVADRIVDSGPALPEVVTLLAKQAATGGPLMVLLVLAALIARRRNQGMKPAWRTSFAHGFHLRLFASLRALLPPSESLPR
jgi:hypothetical protein